MKQTKVITGFALTSTPSRKIGIPLRIAPLMLLYVTLSGNIHTQPGKSSFLNDTKWWLKGPQDWGYSVAFLTQECGVLLEISLMNTVTLWDTGNALSPYTKVHSVFIKLELVVKA